MEFFEGLEDNIRRASEGALLKSVVADPDITIGSIISALEGEKDAKYLLEAFMEMTIGQIVHRAMRNIESSMTSGDTPPLQEPVTGAGSIQAVMAPKTNGKTTKKKSPPKPNGKKAKSNGKPNASLLDLSSPDAAKAYEQSILKTLKEGRHVDESSALSSSELRGLVGGTAAQARSVLDALIAVERVAYYGRARGTKYYRSK